MKVGKGSPLCILEVVLQTRMRNPRITRQPRSRTYKKELVTHRNTALLRQENIFSIFATNLQISAAKMSQAELVKALPELLKQGLEVYKTLKDDMSRELGLKQYAEHLSNIV